PNEGESAIVIANVDGSGERNLVVKKAPQRFYPIFFTGPSWSPDGKLIAASVTTTGARTKLFAYSVADGSEKELTRDSWVFASRVEWMPDMSGLLLVGGDTPVNAMLWFIGYPDGHARRVTNDLNSYRTV